MRFLLTLAVLVLLAVSPAVAQPTAEFYVITADDLPDLSPGDGNCFTTGGLCSLRAAVMEGNALGGEILVLINPGIEVALTLGSAGDADPASGDLDIYNANYTIIGQSPRPRIRNDVADRIFDVFGSGSLQLENVVLERSGGDELHVQSGGAVATVGPFVGHNLVIVNNVARSTGGAIDASDTTFTLTDSVVLNNRSRSTGGIRLNDVIGTIANTQIINNAAWWDEVNYSTPSTGAMAITQFDGVSDVQIIHSTISNNYSAQIHGGVFLFKQTQVTPLVTFTNSIISGNIIAGSGEADCGSGQPGTAAWQGVNLVNAVHGNCVTGAGGAVSFGTPAHTLPPSITGALAAGTLPTISLQPGSPGIGQADCGQSGSYTTDIRGQARPLGGQCDIGAVETPVGQDAALDVSHSAIQHGEMLTITVTDPDLAGAGPIIAVMDMLNTSAPHSANLILFEGASGVFSATFPVAPLPVIPGNGIIEAAPGHVISITYTDLLSGEALQPELNALIDVIAPPAANLLTNGDFEAGLEGWTRVATNGDKVKAKNPYDGVKAFLFKGGAGKTTATLSQKIAGPPISDGDTLTVSAQIDSGPSANGKMKLKLRTDQGRQIKAELRFDNSGAYALHELVIPVALQSGEAVTVLVVTFTDTSPSGKVMVDAASATISPLIILRGDGEGRSATTPDMLPPPAAPDGFRGQN